ncbi:MAG: hypothetical protein ACLTNY_09245, partial [Blautia massiliensis (ex Durand et al. 2017)]
MKTTPIRAAALLAAVLLAGGQALAVRAEAPAQTATPEQAAAGQATPEQAAPDPAAPEQVPAEQSAQEEADAPLPAAEGTVPDAVSPIGTTINLFDYWITTRDAPDNVNPP